jgi:hypothetical protein
VGFVAPLVNVLATAMVLASHTKMTIGCSAQGAALRIAAFLATWMINAVIFPTKFVAHLTRCFFIIAQLARS